MPLNYQLSESFLVYKKEMGRIWYLLRCQEGNEADCIEKCRKLASETEVKEIVCFQYQRMLRYGGRWHMERRTLLPGYIFLSGTEKMILRNQARESEGREKPEIENSILAANMPLSLCEISYLKRLCSGGGVIDMSRGIIQNGTAVVTEGPLKGREQLIKKIDRHKRTAKIKIPLEGKAVEVTVGLEIYRKES